MILAVEGPLSRPKKSASSKQFELLRTQTINLIEVERDQLPDSPGFPVTEILLVFLLVAAIGLPDMQAIGEF